MLPAHRDDIGRICLLYWQRSRQERSLLAGMVRFFWTIYRARYPVVMGSLLLISVPWLCSIDRLDHPMRGSTRAVV